MKAVLRNILPLFHNPHLAGDNLVEKKGGGAWHSHYPIYRMPSTH